jgi:hypothetical protein
LAVRGLTGTKAATFFFEKRTKKLFLFVPEQRAAKSRPSSPRLAPKANVAVHT